MCQHKALSAFEVVKLQQEKESLQAQIDSLMLKFCPERITDEQFKAWEERQRALGDNVHDQISDYWEKKCPVIVNSNKAIKKLEQEDNYVYIFIVVSFTSFLLGFIASYYHYV